MPAANVAHNPFVRRPAFHLKRRRIAFEWHAADTVCLDPAVDTQWVEDLDDPRVAGYRNLKDADLRRERGLFMAEGRFVVETLLEHSPLRADSIFVTPSVYEALRPKLALHSPDLPVLLADQDVFNDVVGFNLHRGCLALGNVGQPRDVDDSIQESRSRSRSTLVLLEGLTNTENVGAVFRNALAFGADEVLLCPRCCDPLYRKSIRVSMGASLRVPFARARDWPRALDALRDAGHQLLALHPGEGSIELATLASRLAGADRVAFVLGAEGEGLREETLERVDTRVRIPMREAVDSLNVATASGIALHELFAARRVQAARGR